MCSEHFVETKIHLFVVKFGDRGWKVDRLAVADARLLGHRRKRSNLDLFSSQPFDVYAKHGLNVFERQPDS